MSTISIQADQNSLIRDILQIQDSDVLHRIKVYIRNVVDDVKSHVATTNVEIGESEPAMAREEIIDGLNAMCEQIKQVRAGKIEGTPWEEFRHELQ